MLDTSMTRWVWDTPLRTGHRWPCTWTGQSSVFVPGKDCRMHAPHLLHAVTRYVHRQWRGQFIDTAVAQRSWLAGLALLLGSAIPHPADMAAIALNAWTATGSMITGRQ